MLEPSTAILGFWNINDIESILINHILTLFKYFISANRNIKHAANFHAIKLFISSVQNIEQKIAFNRNNKKRSHTQLDSRKQVIAFQDRVITINIKEAQHPLKREKQVIDKSSIMLKISTKSMHRVLV